LADLFTLHTGDCRRILQTLPEQSVNCCVTSPPYFGLRDYSMADQIGLEQTPDAYVAELVAVFREVRRALRDDGTLWLNLGDSYAAQGGAHGGRCDNQTGVGAKRAHAEGAGDQRPRRAPDSLKPKDLIGIPWRVAFALQADSWYLRQDIIWHKPNPMPESVTDRCTKAHEYIFLLSKSARYYFDNKAIEEDAKWERWGNQTENKKHSGTAGHLGGKTLAELPIRDKKNRRSVWTVSTKPFKGAHFATFPPKLIEPCILAGCPVGGTVLDPFSGSGTTGQVALSRLRNYIGCELNPEYQQLAQRRLHDIQPSMLSLLNSMEEDDG
jgi:DNA modification methylase